MSNIIYQYGKGLYLNLTNKCPCNCSFCIRGRAQGVGSAGNLWLEDEPTAQQLIFQLDSIRLESYEEVVFCGFGEPFCALDNLLEVCAYLRGRADSPPIRVNTNGLGDLINNKPTAPLLDGLLDVVSISLNAPNREKYNELCRPSFGELAFDAMLQFAKDCKKHIPHVSFSAVDILSYEEMEKCRELAKSMDIPLRMRHYGR